MSLIVESNFAWRTPLAEWNDFLIAGPMATAAGKAKAADVTAVLSERGAALAAQAAVPALRVIARVGGADAPAGLTGGTLTGLATAIVHAGRGRDALWADLCDAWAALAPGGKLVLTGHNLIGIHGSIKRLARELTQGPDPTVTGNRERLAVFTKGKGPGPVPPEAEDAPLADGDKRLLRSPPGVFAAGRLDGGTAVLQKILAADALVPSAKRIVDLACGVGHLGFFAGLRATKAELILADADARAVTAARSNATRLGLSQRAVVKWWDAHEGLPAGAAGADLILCNPPAHDGNDVDLAAGKAMLTSAAKSLTPGARLFVIANRRLPYENGLTRAGATVATVHEDGGYKVLRITRG